MKPIEMTYTLAQMRLAASLAAYVNDDDEEYDRRSFLEMVRDRIIEDLNACED